jgi:hypothetical protein
MSAAAVSDKRPGTYIWVYSAVAGDEILTSGNRTERGTSIVGRFRGNAHNAAYRVPRARGQVSAL